MATTAASTTAERLDLGGHITGKRLAVGAGIVAIAIAVAIGVTAAVRSTDGQASWEQGLNARSDGLNRLYGLGAYSAGAAAAPASNAHNALRLRSEALNAKYHIGTYAVRVTPSAAWLKGMNARSAGLNAKYGVGTSTATISDLQQARELRDVALTRGRGVHH